MSDHLPFASSKSSLTQPMTAAGERSDTLLSDSERQVLYEATTSLLGSSYTQWQFGDWTKLAQLQRADLENQPGRAQLALLAAAGRLQVGSHEEALEFIELAKAWGIDESVCIRVLVSGTFNSLGRAFASLGDQKRSSSLFAKAVEIGCPEADHGLLSRARSEEQRDQIEKLSPLSSSSPTAVPSKLSEKEVSSPLKHLRALVSAEVSKAANRSQRNPYSHNRRLTEEQNAELVLFARETLGLSDTRPQQIDYLASKALQIEQLCVGRLATTVQDVFTSARSRLRE